MLKEVWSYLYAHFKEVCLIIVGLMISLVCLLTVDYLAKTLSNSLDKELNNWGIENYTLKIDTDISFSLMPLKNNRIVKDYSHYLVSYHDKTILRVDADYFSLVNDSLDQGRFFNIYDQHHQNRVAIIGGNLDYSVNDYILIDGNYYRVIGKLKTGCYDLLVDKDNSIIIPYYGNKNEYLLSINNKETLEAYLDYSKVEYELNGLSDLKDSFDLLLSLTAKILNCISFISLIVSITGLSSLSYLSTIHRMNEWGIRKALGASRFQIYVQILLENGMISLVGWICGFMVGCLIIGILALSFKTEFLLNGKVVVSSSLITIISGLASGLLPAAKAMKLAVSQCLKE